MRRAEPLRGEVTQTVAEQHDANYYYISEYKPLHYEEYVRGIGWWLGGNTDEYQDEITDVEMD